MIEPLAERLECANLRPEKKGLSSTPKQSLKMLPISPITKSNLAGDVQATPCSQSTQTENLGLSFAITSKGKTRGVVEGLCLTSV